MDGKEEEPQTKLEATLYRAQEQVECEESHRKDAKKREPTIEPLEIVIQKRGDGIAWGQDVKDDVQNPEYGNDKGADSNDERTNGDEGVVRVVVRRAILEIFDVLFQHVHCLLELEEGFLLLLPFLASTTAPAPALATKTEETAAASSPVVGHLLLLPLNLEKLANIHEFIDALPNGHLRLGKFHGIHVTGTVDKVHDEIQRHRRDANSAEQGKEEPPDEGHEAGKECAEANLHDDAALLFKFVVALKDDAVSPSHRFQLVGLEGEDLRRVGNVV